MPGGLVALLDDVATLTKLAAASLDDVGAAAVRAGTKAVGVVIDDTAVTPRYVVGLSPKRELPIIGRIALGSLRNKLLILLPAALLLTAFAPWALTPLLMAGGAYLCFEGAEKVVGSLVGHHEKKGAVAATSSAMLEDATVKSAVRTDFILSAEIMALALAEVATSPVVSQAIVLAIVAIGITIGVYGVVAVIVKVDDVGLYLTRRPVAGARVIGRVLVQAMPVVMKVLTIVGTAAMIWVGGGILIHGLGFYGFSGIEHGLHTAAETTARLVPAIGRAMAAIVTAAGAGVVGLVVGSAIAGVASAAKRFSP